jgi:hypothetical protein
MQPASPLPRLALGLSVGALWYGCARYLPPQANLAALVAVLLGALALTGQLSLPDRPLLAMPAVCLLLALLWRDSPILAAMNGVALLLLVALLVPGTPGVSLLRARVGEWIWRTVLAGASLLLGAVPAAVTSLGSAGGGRRGRALLAPALGVVAISPVLVVLAVLLSSADARFGALLETVFAAELWQVGPETARLAVALWTAVGLLWMMTRDGVRVPRVPFPPRPIAAVVSALVAIELLFGLFLVLQTRYLFGGRAHVLATEGLTLATYARRGFFELVAVVALTLPVLVLAEACVATSSDADRRRVRAHAVAVLGALLLLLASAASRMLLYTGTFGLTPARVYATAVMLWLALALGWFALTSLRGVAERFVGGALGLAVLSLLLLNLVNVDGLVVRFNSVRGARGGAVDAAHLGTLGAGAVPALLRADGLPAPVRCEALNAMRARLDRARGEEERWNAEVARARGALRPAVARAAEAACVRS